LRPTALKRLVQAERVRSPVTRRGHDDRMAASQVRRVSRSSRPDALVLGRIIASLWRPPAPARQHARCLCRRGRRR
jgi:hypothetical protein